MKYIFLIFSLLNLPVAFAFPIHNGPRPEFSALNRAGGYDFEGIVALSGCSGSLIQFEGQPDTDHAYVLTNGHCYEGGFTPPGEFIYGRASSKRFTLLKPDSSDAGRVQATQAVYVTMTKTDVSLYRLRETYTEILTKFKIRPLTVASTHPQLKEPLDIISGFWRTGYSCNIDSFVFRLSEGGYDTNDSVRYSNSGCDVIGGTSGSPIVAHGTKTLIAINNTGNEDGQRCTENNPCEIDEKGNVFYQKGLNYGQETFWFYSCLTPSYEIDLTKPGCLLPH